MSKPSLGIQTGTKDCPLRLPILTPIRLGFPAGAAVFSLVSAWAEFLSRDHLMVGLYLFCSVVMSGLAIFNWVRYRHAFIVLDESGFWLDNRSSRQGIAWENVRGYEKKTDRLVIHAKQGEPFVVRGIALPEKLDAIYQILDRRIGPDGERIGPERPADPILAKVHDYYGNVPAVEMEPDVVYRHGNRDERWSMAKRGLLFGGFLSVVGVAAFVFAFSLRLPDGAPLIRGLGIGFLSVGVPTLIGGLRSARRAKDRLVMRQGVLNLIRDGKERPLPPPQSKPGDHFQGHPTTRYGGGPFAYVVSHHFLEPDV